MQSNVRLRGVLEFSSNMLFFASWIPVVVWFNSYIAETITISGPSMYPYLNSEKDSSIGQDTLLNYKFNAQANLARGMIITFWYAPGVLTYAASHC